MSPQQPEFVALNRKVDEIHEALIGDPFRGKIGIVNRQNLMMQDLYGLSPDGSPIDGKENTVLKRLSGVEDNQKKAVWIFSGIMVAVVAAKAGISALLEKVFTK